MPSTPPPPGGSRPDGSDRLCGPVLAIESSCDDSAAAVLAPDGAVLAAALRTQAGHAAHGGVVPEIAARAHLAILPAMVGDVLARAGVVPRELALVAATAGPGLIGGLLVGSNLGKGIALGAAVPFAAINHLEAHALSARIPGADARGAPRFPFVLLLLSGGHCQCVLVGAVGDYRTLGMTLDDAAGEAFDKVAKLLGLGWPGGPALEQLAGEGGGGGGVVALPRPLLGRPGCDFSFSGLKTAVRTLVARESDGALGRARAAAIARGFQDAVCDVLADRAAHALDAARAAGARPTALVAAGGVAANRAIRARLETVAASHGVTLHAPPPALCTDNAVTVGWAAIERARAGLLDDGLSERARPRWPLDGNDAGRASRA